MPDLITHLTFSLVTKKLLKAKLSLFCILLGGVFPDLFQAIFILFVNILKIENIEIMHILTKPSHSIFAALLLAGIISFYFKPAKLSFISFLTGYLLHIFLDLFQYNWGNGYLEWDAACS